jgi:MFS family permease
LKSFQIISRVRITRVISRMRSLAGTYPRQFWVVLFAMVLAWMFHSMMWPYILLYTSERLAQPLTVVAGLMTLNAISGLVTTFLGGAIADRFGRKGVMVLSLLLSGIGWFFFRSAGTMPGFALLMALIGGSTPLYRLAADSMVGDIIPEEKRLSAYSVLRMGNNLGVALGPAIGGFLAATSYPLSFSVIGLGYAVVGVLVVLVCAETKPTDSPVRQEKDRFGGYGRIFSDKPFVKVLSALTFNRVATSILWLMLAAYAKQSFHLSEELYGFIPTTNAVMVIFFQLLVSRAIIKVKQERAMIWGALIYAVSIFSVAFGSGFWGFWLCMVGATIGEMILVPTTTTYTSQIAAPEMRARYMGMYTLTWGIGSGIGPLIGGIAADVFEPRAMWYAAGLFGLIGMLIFVWHAVKQKKPAGEMYN